MPKALIALAVLATAACGAAEDSVQPTTSMLPDAAGPAEGCRDGGLLDAEIFGAVEGRLRWRDARLNCEGMPRPDGAGARLRFSGVAPDGGSLAFIIALPELERGTTATETPATITLIDERGGRFFSNADNESCWSDVTRQSTLAGDRMAIEGIVYCVAPLAEVNGPESVRLGEIAFAGELNWAVE